METKRALTYQNSSFATLTGAFELQIACCKACGFVFQESAYAEAYDRHLASVYRRFTKSENFPFPRRSAENTRALDLLAGHIGGAGQGTRLNVLEIGSNRGDFLYLLRERYPSLNVLGVEPTEIESPRVPTIRGFFSSRLFSTRFDLVILQHVFEHVKNPRSFMEEVRSVLKEDGLAYIEVPNLSHSLALGTEDFFPEHVSYFTEKTLDSACSGLTRIDARSDHSLRMVYRKGGAVKNATAPPAPPETVWAQLDTFARRRDAMAEEIRREARRGRKVIFYGASYYFRALFNLFKDDIVPTSTYYYDDNYDRPHEEYSGLARAATFEGNPLVIICSNNPVVQDEIQVKLAGITARAIKPWRTS